MVAVIGLIVFGPRKLPEIARSLGKSFAEFKRQASEIRSEFDSGLDAEVPEDEKPAPPASDGSSRQPESGESTPPAGAAPSA